jgi:hypothetical protein
VTLKGAGEVKALSASIVRLLGDRYLRDEFSMLGRKRAALRHYSSLHLVTLNCGGYMKN